MCADNDVAEFEAIVSGRVQLVMFRDFVRRQAWWLGLRGMVQNQADGTVLIIAQGERESLKRLIGDIHRGSFLARVDRVMLEWREPRQCFDSFRIVY